jgi:hypothetical protein
MCGKINRRVSVNRNESESRIVDAFRCDKTIDHNFDTDKIFISKTIMISPLPICSDYVSSVPNDSLWMQFLQFALSILIYATAHLIVLQNFELLHSWLHPYVNKKKSYFTSTQRRRQSRNGGSYGVKDRCLVFLANQASVVTQRNTVDISQSNDKSHDSSISTLGSTIATRLDAQKKDPRFSWTLKRWKKVSNVNNEGNKNSHCHSHNVSRHHSLKCDRSKRRIQQRSISGRHQYQRYPHTFRNRIENALDRAALWYFVERRLRKSR